MTVDVLFVDDEADVLRGLKRSLRAMRGEWTMRFAISGEEAIAMLEEQPAQILVTDMRMPGMNGAALLREVTERWPFMVRLVLSGQADSNAVKRVVGISHQFLAKPCDTDHLIDVLRTVGEGLTSEHKSRIVAIQALPTLVSTVRDMQEALDHAGDDPNGPAKIIGDDLGLSAKMLQLSNSAYFGSGNGTLVPGDAVRTLGVDLLRRLVGNPESGFVEAIPEETPVYEEVRFLIELSHQLAILADDAIGAAPDTISDPILFRQVCKFLPLGRLLGCLTGAKPEYDSELGNFFMNLWGFPSALIEASCLVWAAPGNTSRVPPAPAVGAECSSQSHVVARTHVKQVSDSLNAREKRP